VRFARQRRQGTIEQPEVQTGLAGVKVYTVGGSVRDQLLGLEVRDRDYVVVGSTAGEMERAGFKPVGRDFPVFLHPQTREEYALARTERKSGHGYRGFVIHASPDVSLEEDLARRDLTINAIAQDANGAIIDPYHGVADLRQGILRHVGPAFVEDPVRVLRTARFAARFGFAIADETMTLMRHMVRSGEVDHLVAERVWQELSRGLMERRPSRMFTVLRECGALARILPELESLFGVPQPAEQHPEIDTGVHVMLAIDQAAQRDASLPVRFAVLTHDLGKGVTARNRWPDHAGHEAHSVELVDTLCQRLRVPGHCCDVARLTAGLHGDIHRAAELPPEEILALLTTADVFRKPERFEEILMAAECDSRGRPGHETGDFPQASLLKAASQAAREVDAGAIAARQPDPTQIGAQVSAARLTAVGAALARSRHHS
jgi:tRNA nucleotidyltransferase (CCA-adding enzyme)